MIQERLRAGLTRLKDEEKRLGAGEILCATLPPIAERPRARVGLALHTDADYKWALKEVERYFDNPPKPETDEADRFDVLSALIDKYEDSEHAIPVRVLSLPTCPWCSRPSSISSSTSRLPERLVSRFHLRCLRPPTR